MAGAADLSFSLNGEVNGNPEQTNGKPCSDHDEQWVTQGLGGRTQIPGA